MKPDFSKLSLIYDALGSITFLGALRRSQNYFLGELPEVENALIIGGGTGTFLIDLLKTGKVTSVDYVDISPGMISHAKAKVEKAGFGEVVNFVCGSENDLPNGRYDLICTNYFLDCFDEESLSELMPMLKDKMSTGGQWLFTDFYLDSKPSFVRRSLVKFLYFFFRVTCGLKVRELPNFDKHFEGMNKKEEKLFCCGLLRSVLWR